MINKILSNDTLSVLILATVIVFLSVLLLNWVFQPTMDRIEWREEIYRVQDGDTLWAIAGEYCPNNVDRREWIEEIRALNDLPNSMIYPGQRLTVLTPTKGGRA